MAGTTPVYGFPYPTGTDQVRDGDNAIQSFAESADRLGLGKIRPSSVSGSTISVDGRGNMTLTALSTTQVYANGLFTTNWDNYRLMIVGSGSTALNLQIQLTVAGVANVNNYITGDISNTEAAGPTRTFATNTSAIFPCDVNFAVVVDIFRPALTKATLMIAPYQRWIDTAATNQVGWRSVQHNPPVAYDGIGIATSTGTFTGSMRCYAYGQ